MEKFKKKIGNDSQCLTRQSIKTIQINIGKFCNQCCQHCHVESGPDRKDENMNKETIDRILNLIEKEDGIDSVDITGGAPELNPHFRYFVKKLVALNVKVINRCNLTVLFEEGQQDTPDFFKENSVEIIASLPCYTQDVVNKQRGAGVFDKSIAALKKLNELGYGIENSGLILNLVYNPLGAFLPPNQKSLEKAYKKELKAKFSIEFNSLFAITNMPVTRFAQTLISQGKFSEYMELLQNNYNPESLKALMCRNQISVGWNGALYNCDFNQMLNLPLGGKECTIWDIKSFSASEKYIAVDDHCFGCTAGAGSSCTGTLT